MTFLMVVCSSWSSWRAASKARRRLSSGSWVRVPLVALAVVVMIGGSWLGRFYGNRAASRMQLRRVTGGRPFGLPALGWLAIYDDKLSVWVGDCRALWGQWGVRQRLLS